MKSLLFDFNVHPSMGGELGCRWTWVLEWGQSLLLVNYSRAVPLGRAWWNGKPSLIVSGCRHLLLDMAAHAMMPSALGLFLYNIIVAKVVQSISSLLQSCTSSIYVLTSIDYSLNLFLMLARLTKVHSCRSSSSRSC